MGSEEVLARYPIRTVPGFVLAEIVCWLLAVLALMSFGMGLRGHFSLENFLLVVSSACLVLLPIVMHFDWRKVAGGRGALLMFADRIEVDGRRRGEKIVLPVGPLVVITQEQRVRYTIYFIPVAEQRVGTKITMRSSGQQRILLSTMFDDEAWLLGFYEDIALLKANQPPLGPRLPTKIDPATAPPVDSEGYAARVDEELAMMD